MVKDNEADGSDGTVKSPDYESRPDECVKMIFDSMKVGADQANQDQSEMSIKEESICNDADGSQRNDDQGGESCDGGDATDKPCHVKTWERRGIVHDFSAGVYPKHGEDNTCHHTMQIAELPRNKERINCTATHPLKADTSDQGNQVVLGCKCCDKRKLAICKHCDAHRLIFPV